MEAGSGAFPDAWQGSPAKGGKGRGYAKGKGKGKDKRKEKAKGGDDRRDEFHSLLEAFKNGTEPGAVPRVADEVKVVQVLGQDRRNLEGRTGKVIGVAAMQSSSLSTAITVHFAGDGASFGEAGLDLTLAAEDLQVVEAARPLPEASLAFPKHLNGYDRKHVHEIAEQLGLFTQSFGEKDERYITAYRRAEASPEAAATAPSVAHAPGTSGAATTAQDEAEARGHVSFASIDLEQASVDELFAALSGEVPEGWHRQPGRMLICKGSLGKPVNSERRTVGEEIVQQLS
eukprot:TRINITY_DN79068_c0_g1_i1.p1 TRINITY_DN79068_c0_g1~~TRINITY_DN79068_c0_g1_i1.p1  ORF type:complete len:287 (+),score=67.52 TRINITY_DN79068_c0_g1_i1:32-892(+)